MAIDPAMEAMMESFLHETETMLEQLEEILIDSERAKSISEENINTIFRITHTIKGSAAMMGFDGVSNLAHAIEDVFYIIRETPDKLQLVFNSLFDLILESSDFLKGEVEKLQSGGEYVEDSPAELIDKLHAQAAFLRGDTDAPAPAADAGTAPDAAPAAAAEPIALEEGLFGVRIFFDDDCQMEHMRAFMLMTQLSEYCESISSVPQNPETNADLCEQIIKDGLVITGRPIGGMDDVRKAVAEALNIKSYEFFDVDTAPAAPAAPQAEAAPVDDAPPSSPEAAAQPAAAAATTAAKPAAGGGAKQSLISVNQSKLDHLMDLVGELVTAESMVARNPDLRGLKLDNFTKSVRELRKLTDELQDIVMSIRMVPLHSTFRKMDRIVRDMCKKLGKKVELVTEGAETEIDKTINDAIGDPFMHMIRNAMDHAIESPEERLQLDKPEVGRITLSARNSGGEIFIDLSDDGRGLDPKKLLEKARKNDLLTKPESEYTEKEIFGMIMLPGFSTNAQVTEFSGRGVGMDVVRKNVEQVGGTISINSAKHQGTTFTIKIPLTLAIVEGMNLSVGGTVFTIPITSIKQSFKITDPSQILHNTNGTEMILLRGECYPVYRLHQMFDIPQGRTDITEGIMIQIESNGQNACIFADELLGEYQVVVKPFPSFFTKYNLKECGLSGCSILGDGSISLILDANNLLNE